MRRVSAPLRTRLAELYKNPTPPRPVGCGSPFAVPWKKTPRALLCSLTLLLLQTLTRVITIQAIPRRRHRRQRRRRRRLLRDSLRPSFSLQTTTPSLVSRCVWSRYTLGNMSYNPSSYTGTNPADPRLPSQSRRTSPPFGRYQIILLGDGGTCVWTTCPGSLPEKRGGRKSNLRPVDSKSSALTTTPSHADDDLFCNVALLLSAMVVHDHCPEQLNASTLIPIPKGCNVNSADSNNYPGIALSPIFVKILHHLIYNQTLTKIYRYLR